MINHLARNTRLFPLFATAAVTLLLLLASTRSQAATNSLTGSIVSGPVVAADISVAELDSTAIANTQSDNQADFSVTLPPGASYPIILTATGGTDMVTGGAPDFTLYSVAFDTTTVANINVFSTIIVKTAQNMINGLTPKNIQRATQVIVKQLNFGLDPALVANPIHTPVSPQNIATFVKANQALAETVRRTVRTLNSTGSPVSEGEYLDAIAADISDGALDGIGAAGSNALYAAVFNATSAQVLIELLNDSLQLNGVNGASLIDNAIRIVLPGASKISIVDQHLLDQANRAIIAVQAIYDAPIEQAAAAALSTPHYLFDTTSSLRQLKAGMNLITSAELIRPGFGQAFDEAASLLVTPGHSRSIAAVNATMRELASAQFIPAKAAQASSYDVRRGRIPGNALDGNPQTKWTTFGLSNWIVLDLGSAHELTKIRLRFYGSNRRRNHTFSVATSADQTSWSDSIQNATFDSTLWTEMVLDKPVARFVRLTLDAVNDTDYVNMNEIEIYGNQGSTPPATAIATNMIPVSQSGPVNTPPTTGTTANQPANLVAIDNSNNNPIAPSSALPIDTLQIPVTSTPVTTSPLPAASIPAAPPSIIMTSSVSPAVMQQPLKNLAATMLLPAKATSTSSYDVFRGRVPSNAVDGNPGTKWTTFGLSNWIVLDLGSAHELTKIRLRFYGSNRRRNHTFSVATSADQTSWSDSIQNATFDSTLWTEKLLSRPAARFVRITLNAVNNTDYANMNEIEIYGSQINTRKNVAGATGVSGASKQLSPRSSRRQNPLTLHWTPNQGDVLGYIVYFGMKANQPVNKIAEIHTGSIGFDPKAPSLAINTDIFGLLPGDSACFSLQAYNVDGISGMSAPICQQVY